MVVLTRRGATWALAGFVGSAVAFILPAHIAIAVLALVGVGIVCTLEVARSIRARRQPILLPVWVRTMTATGALVLATVLWGMATAHDVGVSPSASGPPPSSVAPSVVVAPFNASWRDSVAITILGAGVFLAIPAAWYLRRREARLQSDLFVATLGVLAVGAVAWGARLGDFTMFYLYFAGIAVFATPIAAAAVAIVWERLQGRGTSGSPSH